MEFTFKNQINSIALARVEKAKDLISNGAKFNGVVYGRKGNSHSIDMEVYVDGEKIGLGRYDKGISDSIKEELLQYLTGGVSVVKVDQPKATWTVDGRVIKNNLNYGQMIEMYGIGNFE